MPHVQLSEVDLYFELSGVPDAPVVVLSNSLGTDLHLWDRVAPRIEKRHRVLRYDTRGHGRSSVPPGEYTLGDLSNDVLRLLDHLSIEKAGVCGVSLGGLTALALAVNASGRVTGIVAANTAAKIGTAERWTERIARVRGTGLADMADETLTRWFTGDFLRDQPAVVAPVRETFTATDPEGYTGCCAALRDADMRSRVCEIDLPALLITGSADPVTPPSDAMFLHGQIAGSSLVELPGAHLTVLENAPAFADAVIAFLERS